MTDNRGPGSSDHRSSEDKKRHRFWTSDLLFSTSKDRRAPVLLSVSIAGLAIGIVLAAIASRLMSALLYGFQPDYITTVTVVSLILVGVAVLACLVPARRASRIDPMIALRQE